MSKAPSPSPLHGALASVSMGMERDVEHAMYREAARTSAVYALEKMLTAKPIREEAYGENGRLDLLEYAIRQCDLEDGAYAEFGIYQGSTLGFIATRIDTVVYGFDSFQGLPEDWFLRVGKGAFSLGGKTPQIGCSQQNYRILMGPFSETLPMFTGAIEGPMAFIHMDCCLYSSTATVLDALADRIVAGTIVVFDEYFNYPGWQAHEHRALMEFCEARNRRFDYLAFAPAYHSVAVRFL